ncbi:MAG: helix-turn-helix transcriptional regulator [Planctomycetes bacterium]|nr:helix-turn-helix transcriptional regulator [Planctomycetota bacterium]
MASGDIQRPLAVDVPPAVRFSSPFARLVHDFTTSVDMRLPPRRIGDHALLYFKRGAGEFTLGGTIHPIRDATVFIVRPLIEHSFAADAGTGFHMLNLHFDPVQRDDSTTVDYGHDPRRPRRLPRSQCLPMDGVGGLPETMTVANPIAYERLFAVLLRLVSLRDAASTLRMKAALGELLAWLLQEHHSQDPRGGHVDAECERAARFIRERHALPLTVDAVARHAAVSRSHLAKRFKDRFGLTLMEYLRQVRIEHAKAALLYGDAPIKAIADATGFANVHHFTRAFAADVGMPPASFRRIHPTG